MSSLPSFSDRFVAAIRDKATPLVVGLDPRFELLPEMLRRRASHSGEIAAAYQTFCCEIVDVVAPLVPAVKPQMAFFEQLGPAGMLALWNIVDHCRQKNLIVIMDGKRSDIGSTAEAYAKAYLGHQPATEWGADALTVNPWLGCDSLDPFVACARANQAGIFALVRTSNPGSRDFQSLVSSEKPVYQYVAERIEAIAAETAGNCGYGAVGAVIGATWPEELRQLRALMPHTMFLVPGFGAQGGAAADTSAAFDKEGLGAVVNSSRAIIFGWQAPARKHLTGARWLQAVEEATRESIEQLALETPAGKLRQRG